MICKNAMKQAIVDWCKTRRNYLSGQFVTPLTNVEFNDTLDPKNWLLGSETMDPEDLAIDGFEVVDGVCEDLDRDGNSWLFDCEPFDDQLRAYVKVNDNGKVVDILVQGE